MRGGIWRIGSVLIRVVARPGHRLQPIKQSRQPKGCGRHKAVGTICNISGHRVQNDFGVRVRGYVLDDAAHRNNALFAKSTWQPCSGGGRGMKAQHSLSQNRVAFSSPGTCVCLLLWCGKGAAMFLEPSLAKLRMAAGARERVEYMGHVCERKNYLSGWGRGMLPISTCICFLLLPNKLSHI